MDKYERKKLSEYFWQFYIEVVLEFEASLKIPKTFFACIENGIFFWLHQKYMKQIILMAFEPTHI